MSVQKRVISVIGLGYVGLPVAIAFSEAEFTVVGFDINKARVKELKQGKDKTCEVDSKRIVNPRIEYTNNPKDINRADFHIITVPTPVSTELEPDISYLLAASRTVGSQLKKNDVVVFLFIVNTW